MGIDIYKDIVFEEDERADFPEKFYTNGNRRNQHIDIYGEDIVKKFINTFGFPDSFINKNLHLSVLWSFPRKSYNENNMWVSLSGFTCDGEAPFNHFVISDNIITVDTQNKAIEVLEYVSSVAGTEISYSKTLEELKMIRKGE